MPSIVRIAVDIAGRFGPVYRGGGRLGDSVFFEGAADECFLDTANSQRHGAHVRKPDPCFGDSAGFHPESGGDAAD